jgi:sugar phosphate isomerase/epimerase
VQFGVSTYLTSQSRLTTAWLERAASAGFASVELFADRLSLDYRDHGQLEDLGFWFRDSPLRPHALHTPATANIAEPDRMRRRTECDELKRALEVLEFIPCQYVVQHLGGRDDLHHGKRIDAAFSSLEELNVFARDRGAAILLENGRSELASPVHLAKFLEITHLSNRVCFDVGHAHLGDGVEAGFRHLEPWIASLHVHDNDGHSDQHLLPQAGGIDWRTTMRLLRGHEKQASLALMATVRDSGTWAQPAVVVHDALSRLMDIRLRDEEQ